MKPALFAILFAISTALSAQYAVDPDFGYTNSGYVFDSDSGEDIWFDSAIDSQGFLYLTGWSIGSASIVLGSMDVNGEYNPNYSPNYNRYLSIPNTTQANGYAVAMRSDDKPVVAGIYVVADQKYNDIFVLQANNSGFQDPSFAAQGVFQAGLGADSFVGDAIVGPNNEVFVFGRAQSPATGLQNYFILKLTAEGAPDTSFDGDGYLVFNGGTSNRYLNSGLLLEDGSLLVGGALNEKQIAKILPDGTLDTTFSDDGYLDLPGYVEINTIEQIGDDFYAVGGEGAFNPALCKFSANGTLDSDFGEDGVASLGFSLFTNDAFINDANEVYITGFNQGVSSVTRTTLNGELDETFFVGNSASFSSFDNNLALFTSQQMTDGSIITGGNAIDLFDSGSGQDFVAYRLADEETQIDEVPNAGVQVFPNPTTDFINVTGSSQFESIELFTLSGESLTIEKNSRLIDVSSLSPGIYILRATHSKGVSQQRFVKS